MLAKARNPQGVEPIAAVDNVGQSETPGSASGGQSRTGLSEGTIRGLLLGAFLLLLIVVFSLLSPAFLSLSNARNILVNSSVIGLVSLGQALTIISGGFDLSVSGTVPLGAVTFALLLNADFPVLVAVVTVVAIGAVVGLVNGLVIANGRISALIATLATMSITGGLALTLANGIQVPFEDPSDGTLAQQWLFGISNHVWIFLGMSLFLYLVLGRTVVGRYVYAVGGNREAARLAGIRVDAMTILVYMTSAGLASLGGVVLASQLLTGTGTVGSSAALQSIAAVILGGAALTGGVGGVPGTHLGVFILGILANGMAVLSVPSFYQTMATGAVLLFAVGLSQINLSSRLSGRRMLRRRKDV